MAALAVVGSWPQLVERMMLVNATNSAGIYAFQLQIRGLLWVVSIDDEFLVNPVVDLGNEQLSLRLLQKALMFAVVFAVS